MACSRLVMMVLKHQQVSGDDMEHFHFKFLSHSTFQRSPKYHCGSTMIEVLVTFVVVTVGLIGLLSFQSRLQQSEMEAYQRSQALLILGDMANRMSSNINSAASYVTNNAGVGVGVTCPTGTSTKDRDMQEWCKALQGASETSSESNLGAMIGGRGCIEDLHNGTYMITVTWQGLAPLSAPPESVACAKNLYDGTGDAKCKNDLCRRVATTLVGVTSL